MSKFSVSRMSMRMKLLKSFVFQGYLSGPMSSFVGESNHDSSLFATVGIDRKSIIIYFGRPEFKRRKNHFYGNCCKF